MKLDKHFTTLHPVNPFQSHFATPHLTCISPNQHPSIR